MRRVLTSKRKDQSEMKPMASMTHDEKRMPPLKKALPMKRTAREERRSGEGSRDGQPANALSIEKSPGADPPPVPMKPFKRVRVA